MERLTDNYEGGDFLICKFEDCYIPEEECIVCYACEVAEKAIKKLAEYEDTGLTPQEINVLKIENERLKAEIEQLKEPKKICLADIDIDDPGR